MKRTLLSLAAVAWCSVFLAVNVAFAQGTVFTYQGLLTRSNVNATGDYDFTFKLFNAGSGGTQIGATLTDTGTAVSNGLFTVLLDFGPVFDGTPYWLEIGVRSNGIGAFTTLAPRQELTPAPYAITTENVNGPVSAGQLTGTLPASVVPVPLNLSGSTAVPLVGANQAGSGPAILGSQSAGTGTSAGVQGQTASSDPNAVGLLGLVSSTSPGSFSAAVRGQNNGTGGFGLGVWGSQNGSGWGVYGSAPSGVGVYGRTTTGTGIEGDSLSGIGITGVHQASTGTAPGVQGSTFSTDDQAVGVLGVVSSTSPGSFSTAVRGQNNGTAGFGLGVWGSQNGGGWGGYFTSASGLGVNAQGGSGTGVYAAGATGIYASGSTSDGIDAYSSSSNAVAVNATHTGNGSGAAVQGTTASTDTSATAVYGIVSSSSPGSFSAAVRGQNNGTGIFGVGVYGTHAGGGYGVAGSAPAGAGVFGQSTSGSGVYAYCASSGAALTIGQGAIQVSGADVGTSTAAFIQAATVANSYDPRGLSTPYATTIINSLCDGNPSAILLATHNFNRSVGAQYETHPFSVWYDGTTGHWTIYHDDITSIVGQAFNVLIIKP